MRIYKISFVLIIACALVGCAQIQNLVQPKSPTQTMKNFVEATMKKDVEGVKKSLSSGSLKMMEGLAKMQGKTLDQTIKEGDAGENEYKEMPETRNEKIEGDTATLEVKNAKTSEWETLYFVKETDEWKIALDKSLEEMFKKSLGDWKMPNFGDSNSSTDSDTPSTEKKP
jgi:hypothetical protein